MREDNLSIEKFKTYRESYVCGGMNGKREKKGKCTKKKEKSDKEERERKAKIGK